MDRSTKKQVVEQLKQVVSDHSIVVVWKNKGLTVANANDLRRKITAANCSYRVAKNSLTKIAIEGTQFEALKALLSGPTSISYSTDPVAVAKALVEFAKNCEKLEIVGGVMDGAFLTTDAVKQLATLPSLDELRAKIIGLLQAPAQKIATVVAAPASQVARVVGAYSQK